MLIPEKQVCKHASEKTGEVDGRKVVVEVEDAVHEEEGKVVDGPGTEQLGTGQQVDACGGVVHPPDNLMVIIVVNASPGLEECKSENGGT